jgi:hypothetical protein
MAKEPVVVAARYTPSSVRHYRDNPLIEALPPILIEDNIADLGTNLEPPTETERNLSINERIHHLDLIRGLVRPLAEYLQAEQNVSRLIRNGYVGRRPGPQLFRSRAQLSEYPQRINYQREVNLASLGMLVYGLSGIGKTTMIEQILRGYPDAIVHENLDGPGSRWTQIVYIKVPAPANGSLIGLCASILERAAVIINDRSIVPASRLTVDAYVEKIGLLVNDYSVGLLALDELQNLYEARPGQVKILLNFLTSLTEHVHLPVLGIGTYAVQYLLTDAFKTTRKATSIGSIHFQRPSGPDDEQWIDTVEFLWKYQWVRNPIKLTKRIRRRLYHHSQGVTDILVKLFIAWQIYAMLSEVEQLTIDLLDEAAEIELALVGKALAILRRQRGGELSKEDARQYDDLLPPQWGVDLEEVKVRATKRAETKSEGSKTYPSNGKTIPIERGGTAATSQILAAMDADDPYLQLRRDGFIVADAFDLS